MVKIEPNSNSMREERDWVLEESAAEAPVEKMTRAMQFVHSKKNCLRISEITPRMLLADGQVPRGTRESWLQKMRTVICRSLSMLTPLRILWLRLKKLKTLIAHSRASQMQ